MTLNLVDDGRVKHRNIAGIDLEIFDLVTITKTMPGSTSITSELFVQGLQHDITRTTFTTKDTHQRTDHPGIYSRQRNPGSLRRRRRSKLLNKEKSWQEQDTNYSQQETC
jgi:hypothetical protein